MNGSGYTRLRTCNNIILSSKFDNFYEKKCKLVDKLYSYIEDNQCRYHKSVHSKKYFFTLIIKYSSIFILFIGIEIDYDTYSPRYNYKQC